MPKCDARTVVTRGQAKKLETERLQEEKQLLKDNAKPTGLRVVEEELGEVLSSPLAVVQDTSVAGEVEGDNSLVSVEADDVVDFPSREMDVKADEESNDVSYNHINLEVPCLVQDTDRALFKQQILENRTLKT